MSYFCLVYVLLVQLNLASCPFRRMRRSCCMLLGRKSLKLHHSLKARVSYFIMGWCVCVCICTYICMRKLLCVHVRACVSVYVCVQFFMHVCTCVCACFLCSNGVYVYVIDCTQLLYKCTCILCLHSLSPPHREGRG